MMLLESRNGRGASVRRGLTAGAIATAIVAGIASGVGAANEPPELPFDVANLYFELNDTDGDLGLHGLIDVDSWKRLTISDPNDRVILDVAALGRLRVQGMTELFFESAEPAFDELPPERFFARFPEGAYEIEGLTLEDEELDGEDTLSHVMPAPPVVTVSGVTPAECDGPLPTANKPLIVQWKPVTTSHPTVGAAGPVTIANYQIVLERGGPGGFTYSVEVPPTLRALVAPGNLTKAGETVKVEVLAIKDDGNRTAIEACFVVGG